MGKSKKFIDKVIATIALIKPVVGNEAPVDIINDIVIDQTEAATIQAVMNDETINTGEVLNESGKAPAKDQAKHFLTIAKSYVDQTSNPFKFKMIQEINNIINRL